MDLDNVAWRKSRRSNETGGCVEVAPVHSHEVIAVRDSYDPGGPKLAFDPSAWASFADRVRKGELNG
ncbi:DUF397 domain-containing protein [Actinomadura atramentaria]|uniref:DUF397 domain-containing protein n=1 Tax=Actinomadura atramentaria TaxID=1990 RepID=UPI0009FBB25C|nr:DUF397 domain-containing protein [Actinomadura atramentaria]